jgi:hypothetical protein
MHSITINLTSTQKYQHSLHPDNHQDSSNARYLLPKPSLLKGLNLWPDNSHLLCAHPTLHLYLPIAYAQMDTMMTAPNVKVLSLFV